LNQAFLDLSELLVGGGVVGINQPADLFFVYSPNGMYVPVLIAVIVLNGFKTGLRMGCNRCCDCQHAAAVGW